MALKGFNDTVVMLRCKIKPVRQLAKMFSGLAGKPCFAQRFPVVCLFPVVDDVMQPSDTGPVVHKRAWDLLVWAKNAVLFSRTSPAEALSYTSMARDHVLSLHDFKLALIYFCSAIVMLWVPGSNCRKN
jgi:hypothetical protein